MPRDAEVTWRQPSAPRLLPSVQAGRSLRQCWQGQVASTPFPDEAGGPARLSEQFLGQAGASTLSCFPLRPPQLVTENISEETTGRKDGLSLGL